MNKMHIFGALALTLTLSVANNSGIAKAESESLRAAGDDRSALNEAVQNAEQAKDFASKNPSSTYPGIEKYLEKLIKEADQVESQNVGELTDSLNAAARGANLALGANRHTTVAEAGNYNTTYNQTNMQNRDSQVAETQLTVKVQAPTDATSKTDDSMRTSDTERVTDNMTKSDVADNSTVQESSTEPNQEVVELPNTGNDTRRAGVAELVLAGVAVIFVTAGATAVILKSKKNS